MSCNKINNQRSIIFSLVCPRSCLIYSRQTWIVMKVVEWVNSNSLLQKFFVAMLSSRLLGQLPEALPALGSISVVLCCCAHSAHCQAFLVVMK